MGRAAILTVSFGTSHANMRERAIDPTEHEVSAAFTDRAAYTAWTSEQVVRKVREERGEQHDTLDEALERLAADGVDDVIVQPTCLMQGHEMNKIEQTLRAWEAPATVRLGAPLLASDADRSNLAQVLADEYARVPSSEMVVLMGHGSRHGGNQVYKQMNDCFAQRGLEHFHVATLQGQPDSASMIALAEQRQPERIHLAPLMIVAGDHAVVDMAGEGPESWQSQLEAHGFAVNAITRGLGEYPAVRQLVVRHALEAPVLER